MKKLTPKSTKTDILAAYTELNEKYKQFKKGSDGNAAVETVAAAEVEDSAIPNDIAGDLQRIARSFGLSSNKLQQHLTDETKKLHELRDRVVEGRERLKTLHKIEFLPTTLDGLVTEYLELCSSSETEVSLLKSNQATILTSLQDEWQQKKNEQDRISQDERRLERLSDERLEASISYANDTRVAQELDKDSQQKIGFDAGLIELREIHDDAVSTREAELSAREVELEDLRRQDVTNPAQLIRAVSQAEAEGKAIALRQAKGNVEKTAKEQEGLERVHLLTVESLTKTLQEHETRVASLTQQLSVATQQAQDLAIKAIDGASNEKSSKAIYDIALEQAKVSTKGK